jgi:hypothetical protein
MEKIKIIPAEKEGEIRGVIMRSRLQRIQIYMPWLKTSWGRKRKSHRALWLKTVKIFM